MNERTVLFLVVLSHGGSFAVFLIVILCGALRILAGRAEQRARRRTDVGAIRATAFRRMILNVMLALSISVWFVAISHYGCAVLKGQQSHCMSNMRLLATGASMYSQDYDDRLPPGRVWTEVISPRIKEAARSRDNFAGDPFRCPAAEAPASYGMNGALSCLSTAKFDNASTLVLFFEADGPIRSFTGGSKNVARTRHLNMPNIAYVDGHVKGLTAHILEKAVWIPVEAQSESQSAR